MITTHKGRSNHLDRLGNALPGQIVGVKGQPQVDRREPLGLASWSGSHLAGDRDGCPGTTHDQDIRKILNHLDCLARAERKALELVVRFLDYVEFAPSGCWEWDGSLDKQGYGRFWAEGRIHRAHRAAYVFFVGDIPDATPQIDHLCRVKKCVNPGHLEAVTLVENVMRGVSFGATNGSKDSCVAGHAFTEDNVYRKPSKPTERRCRACRSEAQRVRETTRDRLTGGLR